MHIVVRIAFMISSILLMSASSVAYAQRAGTMNLERIVREAGMIFAGKVIDVETGTRDPEMNLLVTQYTFHVYDRHYGVEQDTITIKQYGGEADGKSFYPKGVPRFKKGEHVLVFFYPPSKIGMTSPVGMDHGKSSIKGLQSTKRIVNNHGNANRFRGIRHTDAVANPQWLKTRTPGELDYAEFALTVRNLVEQLKN